MSSAGPVKEERKPGRVLPPSEKWELFTSVLTGQFTQREAAAKWRVDRSTVTTICRSAKEGALAALSAKPGRPGKTAEQVELEQARAELEQLRATITAQAIELHLYRGKSRWD